MISVMRRGMMIAASQVEGAASPLFTEDFVGADATEVNGTTTDTGSLTWVASAGDGDFLLDGTGKLRCTDSAVRDLVVDPLVTDVDLEATGYVGAGSSNHVVSLYVRYVDENNWIRFFTRGGTPEGFSALSVKIGGSVSTKSTDVIFSSDTALHTWRMTVSGNDIVCYWDGEEMFAYTLEGAEIAALSGATKCGLNMRQSNPRIDSIDAYTFGNRPFSPLHLEPDLWLDASDTGTVTESSGNLTAWADKSGNGHTATTANGDINVGTTTLNGLPTIEFSAGGSNPAQLTFTAPSTAAAVTVAVVMVANDSRYIALGSGGTSSPYVLFAIDSSVNTTLSLGTGTPTYRVNGGTAGFTDRNSVRDAFQTPSVLVIEDANFSSGWPANWYIGGTGSDLLVGSVGEIIVKAGLSTEDRDALEAYLIDKWGMS